MPGEEAEAIRMLTSTQQYLLAPAKTMASMVLRAATRATGRAVSAAKSHVTGTLREAGVSRIDGLGNTGLVRWEKVKHGATRGGRSINWADLPDNFSDYKALGEELRRHGVAASVVQDGAGLTLAFDAKDQQTVQRAITIVLGSCLSESERDAIANPDTTPLEGLPSTHESAGREWARTETEDGPAMHAVTSCKDGTELHQYAYANGECSVERVAQDGTVTPVVTKGAMIQEPAATPSMASLEAGMANAAYACDSNLDMAAVRRAAAAAPAAPAHEQLAKARAANDFAKKRKRPRVVRNIPAAKVGSSSPVRPGIKRH